MAASHRTVDAAPSLKTSTPVGPSPAAGVAVGTPIEFRILGILMR